MKKSILFTAFLIVFTTGSRLITNTLIAHGYNTYNLILVSKILLKLTLAISAFLLIKKWKLTFLAGLEKNKLRKGYLVIPPTLYLILLNFPDELPNNISSINIILLIIYCIAIGFGEELSLRGVLQPLLIKYFGTQKRKVFNGILTGAFIFGLIHLIKFDKGIYGELSQVLFATFIGFCFGALLIITQRIYPLIIAHILIDFVAKTDSLGIPFSINLSNPISLEGSIINTLIVFPVFIYGFIIFRKFYLEKEIENLIRLNKIVTK